MPTIFSHPAVPLAVGLGLGRRTVSTPLLVTGVLAAVLPDLDVLTFRLGIPYGQAAGHRGFGHSLFVALLLALAGVVWGRVGAGRRQSAFWFLFLAAASHGLLDALTNGGGGVALFWPFSGERVFAPWRPIEVAPLTLRRLVTAHGWQVLVSELVWVWLPAVLLGVGLRRARASGPWSGSARTDARDFGGECEDRNSAGFHLMASNPSEGARRGSPDRSPTLRTERDF